MKAKLTKREIGTSEFTHKIDSWTNVDPRLVVQREHVGERVWIAGEPMSTRTYIHQYNEPGMKFFPNGGLVIRYSNGDKRLKGFQDVVLHPRNFNKKVQEELFEVEESGESGEGDKPKRGRGRPRKEKNNDEPVKPKRGRGRPRKYPVGQSPTELKLKAQAEERTKNHKKKLAKDGKKLLKEQPKISLKEFRFTMAGKLARRGSKKLLEDKKNWFYAESKKLFTSVKK